MRDAQQQDRQRHRMWLALWLAACLMQAHATGLWHGVAHAVLPAGLGAAHAEASNAGPAAHDLWHHDAGDGQCRLLDHLTSPALALDLATGAVTPAAPPRVAQASPGIDRTTACAAYLARAPPRA